MATFVWYCCLPSSQGEKEVGNKMARLTLAVTVTAGRLLLGPNGLHQPGSYSVGSEPTC